MNSEESLDKLRHTAHGDAMAHFFITMAVHIKERRDAGLDLKAIVLELMRWADRLNGDHTGNVTLYHDIVRLHNRTTTALQ